MLDGAAEVEFDRLPRCSSTGQGLPEGLGQGSGQGLGFESWNLSERLITLKQRI